MNGFSKQTNLTSSGEKQEKQTIQYMSQTLGNRLTAGLLILAQKIGIRILFPQINNNLKNRAIHRRVRMKVISEEDYFRVTGSRLSGHSYVLDREIQALREQDLNYEVRDIGPEISPITPPLRKEQEKTKA